MSSLISKTLIKTLKCTSKHGNQGKFCFVLQYFLFLYITSEIQINNYFNRESSKLLSSQRTQYNT